MLMQFCRRCGALIEYPHSYCCKCQPIVDAEREAYRAAALAKANSNYNKTRDPKYVRFYNSIDWRTLSRKYMQDKGYKCEQCGGIASEVHHKKAIQTPEGWELRLDYNNLECDCLVCHNKRHNRFKRKSRRATDKHD